MIHVYHQQFIKLGMCPKQKQRKYCMTNETKVCPFCGEEILAVAKKCKHCGEWLDKQQEEVPQVKQCEACGEDIPANATICEHCGESVNNTTTQTNNSTDKFANIDVDETWKKRFAIVEKRAINGNYWNKDTNYIKGLSKEENKTMVKELYFSDILSTLSMLFFTFFYYLAKGMWQKALVYELIYAIILTVVTSLCGIILGQLVALILWILLFVMLCPYDYYRYKILGKQW